jgi:hypothetical protein
MPRILALSETKVNRMGKKRKEKEEKILKK